MATPRERRAGGGVKRHDPRTHDEILSASAFSDIIEHELPVVQERSIAAAIGYLHSTSFAAPHLFGDRLAEFDDRARALLDGFATEGILTDHNSFGVLIARRPSRGASSRS